MSMLDFMTNAVTRRLATMFPGYFDGAKHNHYADFGYPDDVTFKLLYATYTRNSLANAAVDKTVLKTWETNPLLQEFARDGAKKGKPETRREALIRQKFDDLRLWQRLAEADRRSLVGRYAGVILRIADNKAFDQPVDAVSGGLDALVELIPAWEGQLSVNQWDTDDKSPTFGEPIMYAFAESAVEGVKQPRNLIIHPDRVIIWSEDGTLNGRAPLEACVNDLLDAEKVRGGGAEGFWKNAKSSPYLEVDKEAKISDMAKAMGVSPDELADKMNAQVEDFQKGFDKVLMLQGMTAKPMTVTLPASPEQFFLLPVQGIAAKFKMPLKILVGSQSGERASTEDAGEWARTNMSRRANIVVPAIKTLIRRLERFNIIPVRDWHLDWADLGDASPEQKMDRVVKMADANAKMATANGEIVFTGADMRGAVGMEPLSPTEAKVEKVTTTTTEPGQTDPANPTDPAADPAAQAA
ncbi:anti-CBASS protein Acb1 family protein [Caulobacter segnis]|uniref:DUF1073 domain-containing protein n=1 Tax=Caulobacter segnis TaxID=88688 RepID=A0A2W5XFK4_9CAUL|nr:anti-CBASS Acb1 family protein [Caulobacter segnis]PZR36481.1 MAG: DUF1073 domain-containing protein [Caulobacter segnis]